MTIATVLVVDLSNPSEVQIWFDSNPTAQVKTVLFQDHAFYIFYE